MLSFFHNFSFAKHCKINVNSINIEIYKIEDANSIDSIEDYCAANCKVMQKPIEEEEEEEAEREKKIIKWNEK